MQRTTARRAGTALLALASLTALPASAAYDLQITELWPGNDPGGNLTEDWIEITNLGDTAWVSGVDPELYYDDESADPAAADPVTGIDSIAPGEAVVVVLGESDAAVAEFLALWSPVYDLSATQVGLADGSGLGQGGDGAALFVGGPAEDTLVDFEAYPDANAFGGQSWDVAKGAFSEPGDAPFGTVATLTANDAGQPAVGSPGNGGPIEAVGESPEIELLGDAEITVIRGTGFVDPGAVATDAEDGDLTAAIVVGGDTVDPSTFGVYTLTYVVTDSDGNPSPTLTRTVTVTFAESIPAAPRPLLPGLFERVATLGGLPGAEIPAYDRKSRRAFVTSGDGLQVIDLSDPADPQLGPLLDPAVGYGLATSEITSVDACDGLIAFAVPADPQTDPGSVVIARAADGEPLHVVTVGALPDMVTFTPDCRKVLSADEGEPDDGIDPAGSVSVIDVRKGTVRTADFAYLDAYVDVLRRAGVRLFPGKLPSTDFEPEYIAVSPDGREAWVTLQEANAVAVVDIRRAEIARIVPLGLKRHWLPGNELDTSDEDGVINIAPWPITGMYMPDAIGSYRPKGGTYYVTANEGDARDADERVEDLDLDPVAYPPEADLQNPFALGRIQVSAIDGDVDGDGDYDLLQAYGARSFSIWSADGEQVFDSGNQIEAIVATQTPDTYDDGRSDNKGPEPEGVELGDLFGLDLAFIGLERTSQVLVYLVNDPTRPRYLQLLQTEGDEAPEGLEYLAWWESPNYCPTLLVTNEDSNTLTLYQLGVCAP